MNRLVLFLSLLMCAFVTHAAEPLRYVGVPVFYSKFLPKLAPCVYTEEARYGFCGWRNYPEDGQLGVTSVEDQPSKAAYTYKLYDEVVCINGVCKTNYGEPRGAIELQKTTYWYIPLGFYLTEFNGAIRAIKYGNGPLADKYPIRAVKLLPEYDELPDGVYVPMEEDWDVYDVWCNAADECSYMGRVMLFDKLRNWIPKRLSYNCDGRFCYHENGRVVGIDPKS